MADWLIHLLIQIGGTAALLAGAGFVMAKWLWKKINAALESYTTAYANGQAAIDVKMRNIEKLVEEQARLTRTVESIKDEIGAARKTEDNRWAFRKDIYVNLIKSACSILQSQREILALVKNERASPAASPAESKSLIERKAALFQEAKDAFQEFQTNLSIANLATADNALTAWLQSSEQLIDNIARTDEVEEATRNVSAYSELLMRLATAGRNNLWNEDEIRKNIIVASQNT